MARKLSPLLRGDLLYRFFNDLFDSLLCWRFYSLFRAFFAAFFVAFFFVPDSSRTLGCGHLPHFVKPLSGCLPCL